jgi:outer membrane protein assembly factor BamA
MGVGYAYGNSKYLPFIKSFFGGGANDIRAWRARTLGPGAFPKSSVASFDQIGDIKLQFNLEYRYKIYKGLHGATFIDAGNIWLLQPDVLRTGGKFEREDFYKEIATGAGVGFRYDFSFFILRFDFAVPIYDPSFSITNRWAYKRLEFKDVRGQIGIGYPF